MAQKVSLPECHVTERQMHAGAKREGISVPQLVVVVGEQVSVAVPAHSSPGRVGVKGQNTRFCVFSSHNNDSS